MKRVVLLVLFILLPSSFIFAKTEKKVLVYYFKNISTEDSNSELMYKLSICVYEKMKATIQDRQFSLVDEEGLKKYMMDPSYNLWESDLLLNIAQLRGIQEVIFGQFYIEDEKPVIFGKIFFIENGLIIDIGKGQKEYNDILREVEQLSVSEIMAYDLAEKERVYNPQIKRFVKTGVADMQNNLSVSAGVVFPLGEWGDPFDAGISGELFYNLYPRIDAFPMGFGLTTGFVYMNRHADEYYKDTVLSIIPLGVLVRYLFSIGGFVNGITIDFGVGMGISKLVIEKDLSESIDPYMKTDINLVLNPFKDQYISLKFGYMNLAYKDTPFNALFGEMGVIFYF
jgi:hypothetical protein